MSADTRREEQASSRGAERETKDNVTCRAHGKTMCRDCMVVGSKHTCQAMWGTDVELKCGHTAPVLADQNNVKICQRSLQNLFKV